MMNWVLVTTELSLLVALIFCVLWGKVATADGVYREVKCYNASTQSLKPS